MYLFYSNSIPFKIIIIIFLLILKYSYTLDSNQAFYLRCYHHYKNNNNNNDLATGVL